MNDGLVIRPDAPGRVTRRQFLGTLAAGVGTATVLGRSAATVLASPPETRLAPLPTALIYDETSKCHLTGAGAPECPQRYHAVLGALSRSNYFAALRPFQSRPAAEEDIRACHRDPYIALVRREIESGATRLSTGDTRVCRQSLKAAYYAAGAACVGVDAVLGGQAKNAFCVVRPPGHHATADRGMGFCVFNNAAVAARYAQRKYRLGKVLIIDWDVHHGNGTQDIFYEDGSVFYFSTHEAPWYPWTGSKEETGRGKGLGTNLNCPMASGAARKEFLHAFEDELAPALHRFKPELVILSAGFDARHGDPLGRFELTDADFVDLTGLVLEMAREHADGHVVSVLEGGYNLTGLASAAAAHCGRLQQG